MDKRTKALDAEIVEVRPGSREVVAIISTAAVDRENEVVLPQGLVKKNYAGLTVFYDHNPAWPVGVVQWAKHSGERVLGKYRVSDKTQFARDLFALAQDGILTRHSVGFAALDAGAPTPGECAANPQWQQVRTVYRQWELLEFSIVGIPANPEARTLAVAKHLAPETIRLLGLADPAAPAHSDGPVAGRRLLPAEVTRGLALHIGQQLRQKTGAAAE